MATVTKSVVEKSIEVNVPLQTAYNQWTQFEAFPQFMEGVEKVEQLDDKHLRWKADIGWKEKEWTAEIDEQIPDRKISWHSTSGAANDGSVIFEKVDDEKTRVKLTMEYDPEGFIEKAGDVLGVASRRIEGDLKRFKQFIESRGTETGAWRGTI